MKYLSRLTALLLALVLIFSSSVGSIAEANLSDLTRSSYDQMVLAAQEAAEAEAEAAAAAEEAASQPIINEGGEIIEYDVETTAPLEAPYYELSDSVSLAMHAAGEEGEQSVTLSQYGIAELSADASAAGNWQVYVAGQWVNMAGEDSADIEITFAKVQSLFQLTGAAKVRYASADGAQVSDVANIGLYYGMMTTPETDDTFAGASTFSLRSSDSAVTLAEETAADGTEEDPATVIIEIAYRYQNGDTAANSYTAQIEKGGDLTTSVIILPQIPGYVASGVAPTENVTFVAPDLDTGDAGSIQLSLQDVETDLAYVVTYVPTYVDYTVKHWLLGFDGEQSNAELEDEVLVENELKTGEAVGANLANVYEGYTALWYDDTTKVAADGSTVINIYYERNWYLMLFDLGDSAYGVEPIYAQYGADISVGTPTRPGYTFLGWSLDGTTVVDLPATMPAANTAYIAVWEPYDTAKVTVVFWGENADSEEYSYIQSSVTYLETGTEYAYTGNEDLTCVQEEHTHSNACYGQLICSKNEHTHTDDCLICTHTSHTVDCYSAGNNGQYSLEVTTKPNQTLTDRGNGIWSYTSNNNTYYYVQIGEVWYRSSNQSSNNRRIITFACTHSHDAVCYKDEEHVHSNANDCYELSCTKPEHTHTDDCELDTALWKFVRSDKDTVLPDGSTVINVYFDRVEYTFTFRVNSTTVHSFSAKWGSNIREKWTFTGTNGTTYSPENKDSWTGNVLYTQRIYMVEIMPARNITFTRSSGNNNSRTFYYYVESLENTAGENKRLFESKYYDYYFELTNDFNTLYYDEDFFELNGFTRYKSARENGNEYPLSNNGTSPINPLYFYYTRNTYDLVFYNPTELIRTVEDVPYEKPLGEYNWKPDASYAPDIYEPGSVEFAGWYLSPECTGDEYILSDHTMPVGDEAGEPSLVLYAKWELVEHDVTFYLTQEDVGTEGATPVVDTFQVTHYDTVSATAAENDQITIPTKEQMAGQNGNYTFVGWFYMDTVTDADGNTSQVEKAFDPDTMPVTKDLDIYAKWSATEPVEFTIYYKLKGADGNPVLDENGNEIEVAAPTASRALDGTTITAEAKTGNELYEAYRVGFFPKPPSHSVEIAVDAESNDYTFWYTEAEAVPYKVVYLLDNGDGTYQEHSSKTVEDNTNVVVTENYLRISGYMPDAFQKRLIVSYPGTTEDDGDNETDAEKGENIIFFYYIEDKVNAYWTVSHYIEPIGGVTDENPWQQYGVTESQTGKIGTDYTATEKTITGFTLSSDLNEVDLFDENGNKTTQVTDLTEKLPEGGMDFRLYYVRNEYPIKVQHLEQGTNTELADEELYEDGAIYDYQSEVSVSTDKTFHGYELVSTNPQVLPSVQDDGTTLATVEKNVITFYYKKAEVEINYVGVGPDGELITTDEQKTTIGSVDVEAEPGVAGVVTALDGPVVGSTATAASTAYKFVGWYSDEACTNLITTDAKYVPQKQDTDNNPDTADLYVSATYYAKFEWNVSTLVVKKEGLKDGESAIAKVTATVADGSTQNFTITLTGPNAEATIYGLLVDTDYTVSEDTDWTWSYDYKGGTNLTGKILAPNVAAATATLTNEKDEQWLYDESAVVNDDTTENWTN